MRNGRVLTWLLCLSALLVAAAGGACGRDRGSSGTRADSAAAYRRQLGRLEQLERQALEPLAACTGDKYAGDEVLLRALREQTLPRYREFVAGLTGMRAPGGELAGFHTRIAAVAAGELAILERLEAALVRGDAVGVIELNREQRQLGEQLGALGAEFEERFVKAGSAPPAASAGGAVFGAVAAPEPAGR